MSTRAHLFVPFGEQAHARRSDAKGSNRAAGFLRGELGRALRCGTRPSSSSSTTSRSRHADKLTRLIDGAVKSDQGKDPTD